MGAGKGNQKRVNQIKPHIHQIGNCITAIAPDNYFTKEKKFVIKTHNLKAIGRLKKQGNSWVISSPVEFCYTEQMSYTDELYFDGPSLINAAHKMIEDKVLISEHIKNEFDHEQTHFWNIDRQDTEIINLFIYDPTTNRTALVTAIPLSELDDFNKTLNSLYDLALRSNDEPLDQSGLKKAISQEVNF